MERLIHGTASPFNRQSEVVVRDLQSAPSGLCMGMFMIQYQDFERVEMRVGRIVRAELFPEARKPAYKLWIDFGELGEKRSSAQITELYQPSDLVGRQVVAVTNFGPRQIGPFISEVLVLGVPLEGEIVLLSPDREVMAGARVY
jgi:tRNA-binding protein